MCYLITLIISNSKLELLPVLSDIRVLNPGLSQALPISTSASLPILDLVRLAVMPMISRQYGEHYKNLTYVFLNIRFLVEKLKTMSKIGNRTSLEVDVQTVGGSFYLEMNDGSGSVTQVNTCSKKLPTVL